MIDAVIKVGGALLSLGDALPRSLAALELLSSEHSFVVVPGGGPFADAVRAIDEHHSLSSDDAHWMAILGMDQYAILLASRLRNAELVYRRGEIARAHVRGRIPVLAPYRWLREADPLPHSWDVTSDSIAAWIAAEVGAQELILIKPSAHDHREIVDRYFERARPSALRCTIVTPDMLSGSWFPA
ncbi:MAG: delta 1-pyrroline-5-carboxylate synthetase [Gemmatimonadetes bacterium]|nr:delta 1-pyrroline-5-carboxylate synthetase [Gemmatimonadota bacterium]